MRLPGKTILKPLTQTAKTNTKPHRYSGVNVQYKMSFHHNVKYTIVTDQSHLKNHNRKQLHTRHESKTHLTIRRNKPATVSRKWTDALTWNTLGLRVASREKPETHRRTS